MVAVGGGTKRNDREGSSVLAELGLSQAGRQERIAELVLGQDFVAAKDLTLRFDVSLMTIHRDLDELAAQGVLRKVRGGATPLPSSLFESNVRYRMTESVAEKQALARHALSLVEPGQAIMLDDSTTTLAFARLLPSLDAPLTVITNFLASMRELIWARAIRLIVLGGEYLPSHDSFTGIACEEMVAALRADVLFLSTTAVADGVTFQPEPEVATLKQAMMRSATRRVLLIDHRKIGRVALHRLAPLRDFDLVVVDAGIDQERLRQLREAGAQVVIAPLP
jgi:DeoR/GlpR family transcriptional regulator of sugar metabolism